MTTESPTRQQLDLARRTARYHAFKNGTRVPWYVADLDDLTQAALEAVTRKWARRSPTTPLTAWLHLTCRAAVIDEIRRLMGRHEARRSFSHGQMSLDATVLVEGLEDDGAHIERISALLVHEDEPFEDIDERARRAKIVVKELDRLPLNLASVLEMRVVEEMSFGEIAGLMGFTESRAHQMFKEALQRLGERVSPLLEAA